MSEQRRRLGDACVLAVPAEYAGASSATGVVVTTHNSIISPPEADDL